MSLQNHIDNAPNPESQEPLALEHSMNYTSSFYLGRAKEFVELHDQVETSTNLLDSLENFLSTFQKDLSAVSGQISELQERSKDIDNRLKSRRKIEKPLSSLISDIVIPPSLATSILDSDVSESWITTIEDFERRLQTSKARSRVKAARDIGDVAEGLRIVVATKLRAFFLALLQPIRSSVTTNMQVIQTSVLVKYQPLFAFLQRQAPNVAIEIQRAYTGAARTYYETGFRRYIRSLGWIKARSTEKLESITSSVPVSSLNIDMERVDYSKVNGPGVTLAYMGDDKTHKETVEALVRSLLLVLMDNATAEYAFTSSFFTAPSPLAASENLSSIMSPTSPNAPSHVERQLSIHETSPPLRGRTNSITYTPQSPMGRVSKEEQTSMNTIWKQIIDPVLEYCQSFIRLALEPAPPAIPLLIMIRLTEDVVAEVQRRNCPPLESYIFTLRMQMWPIFQKVMKIHIDEIKGLAEGSGGGYFSRATATTDALVTSVCDRYLMIFNLFVAMTEQPEETMIFSNLLRLRQELMKLIQKHTDKITDPSAKAMDQSKTYEYLLQGLTKGSHFITHPKTQEEIAHWRLVEEEARKKMKSVR